MALPPPLLPPPPSTPLPPQLGTPFVPDPPKPRPLRARSKTLAAGSSSCSFSDRAALLASCPYLRRDNGHDQSGGQFFPSLHPTFNPHGDVTSSSSAIPPFHRPLHPSRHSRGFSHDFPHSCAHGLCQPYCENDITAAEHYRYHARPTSPPGAAATRFFPPSQPSYEALQHRPSGLPLSTLPDRFDWLKGPNAKVTKSTSALNASASSQSAQPTRAVAPAPSHPSFTHAAAASISPSPPLSIPPLPPRTRVSDLHSGSVAGLPSLAGELTDRRRANQTDNIPDNSNPQSQEPPKRRAPPPKLDLANLFPRPGTTSSLQPNLGSQLLSPEKFVYSPAPISTAPLTGMTLNPDSTGYFRFGDYDSNPVLPPPSNLPAFTQDRLLDAVWEVPSTPETAGKSAQRQPTRRRLDPVYGLHLYPSATSNRCMPGGEEVLGGGESSAKPAEVSLDVNPDATGAEPHIVSTIRLPGRPDCQRDYQLPRPRQTYGSTNSNTLISSPLQTEGGAGRLSPPSDRDHHSTGDAADADVEEESAYNAGDSQSRESRLFGPPLNKSQETQSRSRSVDYGPNRDQGNKHPTTTPSRNHSPSRLHRRRRRSQNIPLLHSSFAEQAPVSYMESGVNREPRLPSLNDSQFRYHDHRAYRYPPYLYQDPHQSGFLRTHRRTGSVPILSHQFAGQTTGDGTFGRSRVGLYSQQGEYNLPRRSGVERARAATLAGNQPRMRIVEDDIILYPHSSASLLPRQPDSRGMESNSAVPRGGADGGMAGGGDEKRKLMAVTEEEQHLVELMRARRAALNGLHAEHDELMEKLGYSAYGKANQFSPSGLIGARERRTGHNRRAEETEADLYYEDGYHRHHPIPSSDGYPSPTRAGRTRTHTRRTGKERKTTKSKSETRANSTKLTTPPPIPARTSSMVKEDERRAQRGRKKGRAGRADEENDRKKERDAVEDRNRADHSAGNAKGAQISINFRDREYVKGKMDGDREAGVDGREKDSLANKSVLVSSLRSDSASPSNSENELGSGSVCIPSGSLSNSLVSSSSPPSRSRSPFQHRPSREQDAAAACVVNSEPVSISPSPVTRQLRGEEDKPEREEVKDGVDAHTLPTPSPSQLGLGQSHAGPTLVSKLEGKGGEAKTVQPTARRLKRYSIATMKPVRELPKGAGPLLPLSSVLSTSTSSSSPVSFLPLFPAPPTESTTVQGTTATTMSETIDSFPSPAPTPISSTKLPTRSQSTIVPGTRTRRRSRYSLLPPPRTGDTAASPDPKLNPATSSPTPLPPTGTSTNPAVGSPTPGPKPNTLRSLLSPPLPPLVSPSSIPALPVTVPSVTTKVFAANGSKSGPGSVSGPGPGPASGPSRAATSVSMPDSVSGSKLKQNRKSKGWMGGGAVEGGSRGRGSGSGSGSGFPFSFLSSLAHGVSGVLESVQPSIGGRGRSKGGSRPGGGSGTGTAFSFSASSDTAPSSNPGVPNAGDFGKGSVDLVASPASTPTPNYTSARTSSSSPGAGANPPSLGPVPDPNPPPHSSLATATAGPGEEAEPDDAFIATQIPHRYPFPPLPPAASSTDRKPGPTVPPPSLAPSHPHSDPNGLSRPAPKPRSRSQKVKSFFLPLSSSSSGAHNGHRHRHHNHHCQIIPTNPDEIHNPGPLPRAPGPVVMQTSRVGAGGGAGGGAVTGGSRPGKK